MGRPTLVHRRGVPLLILGITVVAAICDGSLPGQSATSRPAARQTAPGPLDDPAFFPVAVWLQAPANAPRFRAAGINLYIGLWQGPTDDQLAALRQAEMPVICDQNAVGLAHRKDPTIVAWMHGDEPDNAQPLPDGKGYGPPIKPEVIVADYRRMKAADPTRPVLLNLGQGVALDEYRGRGVRTNQPDDYPRYCQGGDLVSFDIYPANHDYPAVRGNAWFVARGVDRLRAWAGESRRVWNCIETTGIDAPAGKPTPHLVRAEVWMSLIHGSRGIIYFVHQFKPRFIEAGLLADPEMLAAVTAINGQIRELAPALNAPVTSTTVTVSTSNAAVPVDARWAVSPAGRYVFAVAMRDGATTATFRVPSASPPLAGTADVIGENRSIPIRAGAFEDTFHGYDVHLYRLR